MTIFRQINAKFELKTCFLKVNTIFSRLGVDGSRVDSMKIWLQKYIGELYESFSIFLPFSGEYLKNHNFLDDYKNKEMSTEKSQRKYMKISTKDRLELIRGYEQ